MCSKCNVYEDCGCDSKTLSLEIGKTYLDRDNNRVRVVSRRANMDKLEFLCLVMDGNVELPVCYSLDGQQWGNSSPSVRGSRLIKEWKEPEYCWVNLYPHSVGTYRLSKEVCDRLSTDVTFRRIGCIRVDLETGEVKNEKI